MDGHARGVAALLEERFTGQRVHVFGNSMGGAVAVHLAARRPDLVRSLTLISPALPARRPRPTNVHLPAISMPVFGEWSYDRYQKVSADRRAQASIDLCFAEPSAVPPFRKQITSDLLARRDGYPYAREAFLGSLRALMGSYVTAGANRPWALARTVGAPVEAEVDDRDPGAAARLGVHDHRVQVQAAGHEPQHVGPTDEVADLERDGHRAVRRESPFLPQDGLEARALGTRDHDEGVTAGRQPHVADRAVRGLLEGLEASDLDAHLLDEPLGPDAFEGRQEERNAAPRERVDRGDVSTDRLLPEGALDEVAAADGLLAGLGHRSILRGFTPPCIE
jgi:pimeloyl-ACP methyl ester carboxylesterase